LPSPENDPSMDLVPPSGRNGLRAFVDDSPIVPMCPTIFPGSGRGHGDENYRYVINSRPARAVPGTVPAGDAKGIPMGTPNL